MSDDEQVAPNRHYGKGLTLHAYPKLDSVPGKAAMRRRWVLRFVTDLPRDEDLQDSILVLQ